MSNSGLLPTKKPRTQSKNHHRKSGNADTSAGGAGIRHRLPLATWSGYAHRRRTQTRFPSQITTQAGSVFRRWHIPTTFSPSAGAVCPQPPADMSECVCACGLPFHIYVRIWSARKHKRRQPIRATPCEVAREESFFEGRGCAECAHPYSVSIFDVMPLCPATYWAK